MNAYRRVWHTDLARDDVQREQNKLRIQRINVAWDIIQKTHAVPTDADEDEEPSG